MLKKAKPWQRSKVMLSKDLSEGFLLVCGRFEAGKREDAPPFAVHRANALQIAYLRTGLTCASGHSRNALMDFSRCRIVPRPASAIVPTTPTLPKPKVIYCVLQ